MSQTLSKQIDRLVDHGMREAGDERDIKMFTRMMIQTVIPRKKTDEREITLRNGHFKIGIQAGMGDALPSGSMPRLILISVIAEAIRTQNRVVSLGSCLAEFMDTLGIEEKSGGRWGTITRVKEAARQLFKARVAIEFEGPNSYALDNIQFADRVRAYWTTNNFEQTDIEGHTVELHELFYKYVTQSPFPLDFGLIKALARSPLGIDLAVWLSYRVYNLKKPAALTWDQLHEQMGGTYGTTDDFVRNAKRELVKIKAAWPGLNYETPRGRLVLHPSALSVPETKPRKRLASGKA